MADILGKILYTEEQIIKRAKELGKQLTKDYKDKDLVVLGTLKGSVMWMSELVKHIDLDLRMEFISASSYGASKVSSGIVKVTKDIGMDIHGKDVLIVEDIVDSGNTLAFLKKYLAERGPESVKICTMLDKPSRRVNDLKPDYVGYVVDDLFIVGYGLDFDQHYRNLPYVSYLEPEDVEKL